MLTLADMLGNVWWTGLVALLGVIGGVVLDRLVILKFQNRG